MYTRVVENKLYVSKIDTGYLVNKYNSDYESSDSKSAFSSWDEAVNFIKDNPPFVEKREAAE